MAIDIIFYTKIDVDLVSEKLNKLRSKYPCYFDDKYILYDADRITKREQLSLITDRVDQYSMETKLLISEEYGLPEPKSWFMIAVNDKTFSTINTTDLSALVKKELGGRNIIALLNGEVLI